MRRAVFVGFFSALLAGTGLACGAELPSLSEDTLACLSCHDKRPLAKKLGSGEVLPLTVSKEAFLSSKHSANDCTDCHSSLDDATHGKTETHIESRRAYALSMQPSCMDCHKKIFAAYEESRHAKGVGAGDASTQKATPLCTDCHNPHEERGARRVFRDACMACHEDALAKHQDWLPNASRHFDAIACPVCHAPDAQRQVSLRLFDKAQAVDVVEKAGAARFEQRMKELDARKGGLGEQALRSLLNEYNAGRGPDTVVLRGRLDVSSGVQAHQLSDKARAIRDCSTCHKAGAQAFQSVSLTIGSPDGRVLRHPLQKDVLTSLTATQSVGGFYAIGSTRIKLLDGLLVLVLVGVCIAVAAHASARWFFKRRSLGLTRGTSRTAAASDSAGREQ